MATRVVINGLKWGASLAIVAYLCWRAMHGPGASNAFTSLIEQPKHWGLLTGALAATALVAILTSVRWWLLVRALDVPCRLSNAVRIGYWALLFNLAPLGIVVGDLVKVMMLARHHPENRARVAASVLVDRVIGLYMLFVFATGAISLTGFASLPVEHVTAICDMVFLLTAVGTLGIAIVLIPGASVDRAIDNLATIPRVGVKLQSLLAALRLYRRRPWALLGCAAISAGIHGLSSFGCYLIARGLPGDTLPLADHFVVIPLSIASAVLPLPLGPIEFVVEFFFTHLPTTGHIAAGQGLLVALVLRLMNIVVAASGVLYYLSSRRELAAVIHAAAAEPPTRV